MSEQTSIRIDVSTRDQLKEFGAKGQSMDGIITDLLINAKNQGQSAPTHESGNPQPTFDDERVKHLEDMYTNVVKKIQELKEQVDSLIPGIEHQKDESVHAMQMASDIQKRLKTLEERLDVTVGAKMVEVKLPGGTVPAEDDKAMKETSVDPTQVTDVSTRPEHVIETSAPLTAERDQQIAKIKQLKKGGMGITKIAEKVGVPHSQLSKLMNPEKYPNVILKPDYSVKSLTIK